MISPDAAAGAPTVVRSPPRAPASGARATAVASLPRPPQSALRPVRAALGCNTKV